MDFFVWAAVSPSRTVVMDAAADERTCEARGHQFLRCQTDEALAASASMRRTSSASVTTHLHWDHAGNLGSFPDTQLHVQRTGASAHVGPLHGPGLPATAVRPGTGSDLHPACLCRARHLPQRRRGDRSGAVDPRRRRPHPRDAGGAGQHPAGSGRADVGRGPLLREPRRREPVPGAREHHRLRRDVAPLGGSRSRPRPHLVPGHDPLVLASHPPARPELAGVVARLDVEPATTTAAVPA